MPVWHLVSHERPHWPIFFKQSLKFPLPWVANHHEKRWECRSTHSKLTNSTYRKPHHLDFSFPFLILLIKREIPPIYIDDFRTELLTELLTTILFNQVSGQLSSWHLHKAMLWRKNSFNQIGSMSKTSCNF